jgi:ATP-dependent Lhr-like helicase
VVRGWLECTGPATEAALAAALSLSGGDVAAACARLEGDGNILRGHFTPGETGLEWCDRRLLARIHRLTLGRLRREIEPVTPADHARFLERWQHLAPGTQLHGVHGVLEVLGQLQGLEAPVGVWETEILPARVSGYGPALLDEVCLAGEVVWGRRSASAAERTTRATPIALWLRPSTPWLLAARPPRAPAGPEGSPTEVVAALLAARGALFYGEIQETTGLLRRELDDALWALVAGGRVTADGFAALRTLADESPRRTGRWALLTAPPPAGDLAEAFARQLLRRYGVVHRELVKVGREILPPWRDVLLVFRRLEARGEIRGGRFVAGVVGEQFALADAVDALRFSRRQARAA